MSRDNTLRMIDIRSLAVSGTLQNQGFRISHNQAKASVCSVSANDPSFFVSAGSQDGSIYIWNALTCQLESILPSDTNNNDNNEKAGGHSGQVCAAVWNPLGGSLLYSAEIKQRRVIFWGDSVK